MKEDFDYVLKYAIDYHYPNNNFTLNENIFDSWFLNKKDIFNKYFKDKLILEYPEPFQVKLTAEAKMRILSEFCDNLEEEKLFELSDFCYLQETSFFDNKVILPYNSLGIKKNEKLTKSFKYFIKDKEKLDKIQNLASSFIQRNKITGTLCISIHPVDYLTISENSFGWGSCHGLLSNHSHVAGNLSFLCDTSTVVLYLKDVKGFDLFPNFHWNSKKWRMLLHMNEDQSMIISNKQYPFELDVDLSPYLKYFFNNQKMNFKYEILELDVFNYIVEDFISKSLFFNDIFLNNKRHKFYLYKNFAKPIPAIIGEKVLCPVCAKEKLIDGDNLICKSCKEKYLEVNNG